MEKFVWPWVGILGNIERETINGRPVGRSGFRLRDELRGMGYNKVIKVEPVWDIRGHSGFAMVLFESDFSGFAECLMCEKYFTVNRHGRIDYHRQGRCREGLYFWMAREDDYTENGPLGKELRKHGDLKTIEERQNEEKRKDERLISVLLMKAQTQLLDRQMDLAKIQQRERRVIYDISEGLLGTINLKHELQCDVAILRSRVKIFQRLVDIGYTDEAARVFDMRWELDSKEYQVAAAEEWYQSLMKYRDEALMSFTAKRVRLDLIDCFKECLPDHHGNVVVRTSMNWLESPT